MEFKLYYIGNFLTYEYYCNMDYATYALTVCML